MVGVTGLEPAAPCSQSTCATKLRYTPMGTLLRGSIIVARSGGSVKGDEEMWGEFNLRFTRACGSPGVTTPLSPLRGQLPWKGSLGAAWAFPGFLSIDHRNGP